MKKNPQGAHYMITHGCYTPCKPNNPDKRDFFQYPFEGYSVQCPLEGYKVLKRRNSMKSRSSNPFDHIYHDAWQMMFWPHDGVSKQKKKTFTFFLQRFQPLLKTFLAAIAIGLLFLGGAYFFLIQLAEYGW